MEDVHKDDTATGMESQSAAQPMNQDSPQEPVGQNQETPSKVSLPSVRKFENVSSEGGPYGPWMLVKRQPRRKSDFPTKKPTQNNAVQQAGSRFALLEQEGSEENIEIVPNRDLVPVTAKVRDHNAGKNSHKDQKGKNPNMDQHNQKEQIRKQVVKKDNAWGPKEAKGMPRKAVLNSSSLPNSSKIVGNDLSKGKQILEKAD
ncbi:hypothetical protein SESBI_17060 [Sesbania bispinosa]|nr:hypothetical protein SESBI_17060 [Sesbania bispinosa]